MCRRSTRERETASWRQEVAAVATEGLAKLVMHESRWRNHQASARRMEETQIARVGSPAFATLCTHLFTLTALSIFLLHSPQNSF